MNRIEKSIISAFQKHNELSSKEIVAATAIPKSTVKKYLVRLLQKGEIEALGQGRGRYYRYRNPQSADQAAVFKSGKLVGYLSYAEGRYVFAYDRTYKGKKLDGLFEDQSSSVELFPVFENLIPESDRRDRYTAEGKNLVEILLELENTHGDFDFVSPDRLHTFHRNYSGRKYWITVKERILGRSDFLNLLDLDLEIDKAIMEAKGKYSSLSGYQNKIDIAIDFEKRKVEQSQNAHYLLKPYHVEHAVFDFRNKSQTYMPYLGLNEHLFMSFAKNAYGFDVPWNGIIVGEKDFHYVVKRYDRYDGYKYEQRDFAQIMNITSDQKYFTTSEKLFDVIGETVKSKEERMRFLEFYLFSFVIEHADLHLKNISVIDVGRDRLRLSPLYDLISNGVYRGDSDELGLPVGGRKRHIPVEAFYALAARIGISTFQSKKIFRNVMEIFIESFPSYIEESSKIALFDRLKIQKNRYSFGSFSDHLQAFYDRRIESLKQRGYFKALRL